MDIWTKEIDVLNRLSTMDDADGNHAAMAEMKTAIKEVVQSVSGVADAVVGTSKKNIGGSKTKTSRKRAEEYEDEDAHDH
jgi:division protein CdvB (Snf7/Vps24/ESCRT-III family)